MLSPNAQETYGQRHANDSHNRRQKEALKKQLANAYIVTKWQQRHALPFQLKRCGDTLHLGSKKTVGFNTRLNLRATV